MGLGSDVLQIFDLFKYQISLRTRRSMRYRPGEKMYYGSNIGVVMSITVMTLMVSYFAYLWIMMSKYNKDSYNS